MKCGICADLHTDFMHDADSRFSAFLETARDEKCDFLIELGDFCPPGGMGFVYKERVLSLIKNYDRPLYHVLGNHDMDENKKEDVLRYIGQDRSYFSFDAGGIHFVVLDTCYFADADGQKSYEYGNYKEAEANKIAILPDEELEWLESDLMAAKHKTVIFSHHSLIESRTGIRNPEAFRRVIKNAPLGVILCVCGHEHVDRLSMLDGTYYLCINSMSYYWAGSGYSHSTYGDDIERSHPILRHVFPYRDPLFAIVEITDDRIVIRGRESYIVGASPESISFRKAGLVDKITPSIADRELLL